MLVRVSDCVHGTDTSYGVFLHDSLELSTHPVDQSGLLHPPVAWSTPTSGVATLTLRQTTRLGPALLNVVCDNGAHSQDVVVVR